MPRCVDDGNMDVVTSEFSQKARAVVYEGDCLDLLETMPNRSCKLIVTSPPYHIGKAYERREVRRSSLQSYLELQSIVIEHCVEKLVDGGSICWQVGNHVVGPQEILPLDIPLHAFFARHRLKLRNRIIWHFEHGLHCAKRFSGRYETILWYTKGDRYTFNLDAIRVPQKYPGKKYFRGPKAGQYSCNPLGKNPGDLWVIPNVKHNHVEKTIHPCQFPVELVQRLVLALTEENDIVFDPFAGVGSTMVAAVLTGRRGAGAEIEPKYCRIARQRLSDAMAGRLRIRPMDREVYVPSPATAVARRPNTHEGMPLFSSGV